MLTPLVASLLLTPTIVWAQETSTQLSSRPRFKGKAPRLRSTRIQPKTSKPQAVLIQNSTGRSNSLRANNWNLRTAPATLLLQWISLDLAYTLTDHWTLGPSLILYNAGEARSSMFTPAMQGTAYGINANYFFRHTSLDSWYLGAHGFYENYTTIPHGSRENEKNHYQGLRADFIGGYQWRWSYTNLMLGGGFLMTSHEQKSAAGIALELKFGFVF